MVFNLTRRVIFFSKEKSSDRTARLFFRRVFWYSDDAMSQEKKDDRVFDVVCPCCHSILWVDGLSREVVKSEKSAARKKENLDALLEKERKRQEEFERKFEATAELEKRKKERAAALFEKALGQTDKDD